MKHKNIILISILAFITLFFGINNIEAKEYEGYIKFREEIPGIYFNKIRDGVKHSTPSYLLRRSTDDIHVYCLEPGINVTNFEKYQMEETNQAKLLKITEKQWERATLLAYYGYQYGNHTDKKWYAITQYLIWKEVSPEVTVYFTDGVDGAKITPYTKEINELNNLVNNHLKLPSMVNNTFEVGVNNKIIINDNNGVLNNYKAISSNGINAKINGNELNITGLKLGNNTINLEKEDIRFNNEPIIYLSDISQKVMQTGRFPKIKASLNVIVKGGNLDITKYGEKLLYINNGYKYENKLLKNVEFELYADEDIYNLLGELVFKKNEKITELKTDENGNAKLENALYLGKYYLLEKSTSDNHVLDNKKYEFTIKYEENNNLEETITLYNHLPKGSLKLLKVNHKGESLSNAYFEIFNSENNLVFRGYTDKNGLINIEKLPLGTYYIKEIKAPDGYKINREIIKFEITKDGQVIDVKAKNDLIVNVPITDKNEFPLFEVLSLTFALTGILILIYAKKNKRK